MSRSFRFLILNTDYGEFLTWFYAQHPGLETAPYAEQLRARMESLFGVADFYSSNLCKLEHEAWDIHANNEFMQRAWAREHGLPVELTRPKRQRLQTFMRRAARLASRTPARHLGPLLRPLVNSWNCVPGWFYRILAAQIERLRPDVLLNQAMDGVSSRFLREMKPHVGLLVGQIASPLPEREDFSCYDLVLSSLPHFVDDFRSLGLRAELHRFAFEPRILESLKGNDPKVAVSFVGSLSSHHAARIELIEYLCARHAVDVWGQGAETLPADSSIRRSHKGQAWGYEMYQALRDSKITLNHHIGVAGPYANNMRLFEATGVGTLLLTDWKENLGDMFEQGKEIIVYRTPEECAELLGYYLEHDQEQQTIARAGQERTLRDHNYFQRMEELVDILRRYL